MKNLIFVSYAREDSDFARRLATDLKAKGANIWLDQIEIKPGQQWDREIEMALAACSEMLVILSPSSVDSNNVMDEVAFALDENKRVIPVLHLDCKLPFRLRRFQYVAMSPDYACGLTSLLTVLSGEQAAERAMGQNPADVDTMQGIRNNALPNLRKVAIEHVVSFEPNKDLIREALRLYEGRIPADERVDLEDLVGLIRMYLSRKFGERFLMHFLVATFGGAVVGMLMCYEDTEANFAFIPYLAARNPRCRGRNPHHITQQLGMDLLKIRAQLDLPPLRLLFESEDPRLTENRIERIRCASRIKLFERLAPYEGLRLRALNLRFLQPRLEWPSAGQEKEILLFIAASDLGSTLATTRVEEILTWMYTELYSGKIFDYDPKKRAQYREYTRGLLNSLLPILPESVRLLRSSDIIKKRPELR